MKEIETPSGIVYFTEPDEANELNKRGEWPKVAYFCDGAACDRKCIDIPCFHTFNHIHAIQKGKPQLFRPIEPYGYLEITYSALESMMKAEEQ